MSTSGPELHGRVLHPGSGRGVLLVLEAPLSFWGGTDHTGTVIDPHHPQCGQSLAGRVVAMPAGRGSSSSSGVLAEQIRAGAAPAALVLSDPDTILVVAALVAAELYGLWLPIVQVDDGVSSLAAVAGLVEVTAPADSDHATEHVTVHATIRTLEHAGAHEEERR